MRRLLLSIIALLIVASNSFGSEDARPWSFWYWMYGAVSKPAIHADLLGMKQIGLGGCYLMPIRGVNERPEYGGDGQQLSPKFWEYVDYTFAQADSLGLDLGIHVCDGFALAGSPVITPEESMKKVVWTDTVVVGSLKPIVLSHPEAYHNYYKEIACFAFPVKEREEKIHVLRDRTKLTLDGDMHLSNEGTCTATEGGTVTLDCGTVKTVRSLQIVPSGNNIQSQRLTLMASNDGEKFSLVRQLIPARQGWQSSGSAFTYSLPKTTARYFRFSWTPDGTEPGSEDLDAAKWKPILKVRDIILSSESKVDQWEGKTAQSWRIAERTDSDIVCNNDCVQMNQLIKLQMKGDTIQLASFGKKKGQLYRIIRFGYTSTGLMNATAGGGKGLEIDKFDPQALDKLLDNWFRLFIARPHANVVKVLHVDSWECGSQNWGKDFAAEFKQRRGYDILPYMLLYAGIPVSSAAESERVMRDIRFTINDLVNEKFFDHLVAKGHEMGMRVSQESIAPTFVADGIEHYKSADLPMGEYWLNSPTHDKPNDMLDAISGAHLYGKNIVQAEGFTEVRGVWNETPAMIKSLLDRNFALGMNKLVFHVNAHNPWMDRTPGMTLDGIGLFFQRNNTWYREANGLVDYIIRCQKLLQRGKPVSDIAVFTGEEMPSRSLTPDRLVKSLPGLFGDKRVHTELYRLGNVNQPMTESPVGVMHSSGIIDLADWVNALNGYQYDSMNKDALLNIAKVVNGSLQMPGGNSYKVLVLPGSTKMDPSFDGYSNQVKAKIDECRKAGIIVVDKPFVESSFINQGLARDVILPENIAYTHRSTDNEEIYFLANSSDELKTFTASFRVSGREPYLYDALNDEKNGAEWTEKNGRIEVSLHLDANSSLFVIFPKTRKEQFSTIKDLGYRQTIVNKWDLHFITTNETLKNSDLISWTELKPQSQKYYSGSVEYSTTFKYKHKSKNRVMLNVGTVHDLAHVYVNDVDCGIAWTAPYEVNITKALHQGKNELRILVTNTWANALLGVDSGLPPFKGIWTNAKYRMKDKELQPAGLIGPVMIKE